MSMRTQQWKYARGSWSRQHSAQFAKSGFSWFYPKTWADTSDRTGLYLGPSAAAQTGWVTRCAARSRIPVLPRRRRLSTAHRYVHKPDGSQATVVPGLAGVDTGQNTVRIQRALASELQLRHAAHSQRRIPHVSFSLSDCSAGSLRRTLVPYGWPSASFCSPGVSLGSSLCVSLSSWSGSAVSLSTTRGSGAPSCGPRWPNSRATVRRLSFSPRLGLRRSSPSSAMSSWSRLLQLVLLISQLSTCRARSPGGDCQAAGDPPASSPSGSAAASSSSGITSLASSTSFKGAFERAPDGCAIEGDVFCDGSLGCGVAGAVDGRSGTR